MSQTLLSPSASPLPPPPSSPPPVLWIRNPLRLSLDEDGHFPVLASLLLASALVMGRVEAGARRGWETGRQRLDVLAREAAAQVRSRVRRFTTPTSPAAPPTPAAVIAYKAPTPMTGPAAVPLTFDPDDLRPSRGVAIALVISLSGYAILALTILGLMGMLRL